MVRLEQIVNQLESLTPESLAELASYVEYLKWKQGASLAAGPGQPWAFDFVEHFRRAVLTADYDPAGMEVQIGEAACAGKSRMALWQHPPVQGSAIVEYQVPVPANVSHLRLRFATGIRDGSQLAEGNVVAFRIFVNDWKIWRAARKFKPDLFVNFFSPFAAHVGKLMGKPVIGFHDTEHADLTIRLSLPFTDTIVVPECYRREYP